MANENTDEFVADTAPELEQTGLDAETFQAWQSELKDFIAVTHDRLQVLSQALSHNQHVQTISQDRREIVTQSETAASTPMDGNQSPGIVADCEPAARQTSDSETDSLANGVINDDPMERLNAIKRRLANQMQNAS